MEANFVNKTNVFEVGSEELIYDEIDFDFLGRATVKGKVLIFRDNEGDRCWLTKTPKHGFKAMKLHQLINNN
jgi:hypothetical protein